MNFFLKKILIILLILSFSSASKAEQIIKFVNIDKILNETNIGKKILSKIKNIDKENIEKLESFEKEIKDIQNNISQKKNIISQQEFEKEVNDLNKKVSDFNDRKNNMVKEINQIKNKELNQFLNDIKPIIQNYMNDNSIDMIINSKNIFIGNINSDLTNELINEININFQ